MHTRPVLETFFPTDAELMEAAIAEEDQEGPNNPIPGSEWQSTVIPVKPAVYFDGVKLANALSQIAHEASARAWTISNALRNVRLAETKAEMASATSALEVLFRQEMVNENVELKIRMMVEQLANTIDADVRPMYPDMTRYYAYRPVWEFINAIKSLFKR